jgi:hypothetical protein
MKKKAKKPVKRRKKGIDFLKPPYTNKRKWAKKLKKALG